MDKTFFQIRFVSDLTNVNAVSTRSILGIYKKFAELTLDTESPQVRTDFYVYCILSSISWNAKILYEKHGPDFDEILDKIKNYLSSVLTFEHFFSRDIFLIVSSLV